MALQPLRLKWLFEAQWLFSLCASNGSSGQPLRLKWLFGTSTAPLKPRELVGLEIPNQSC
jgi:hypothetical protein